ATTPGPVRTAAGGPNPGAQETAAAEQRAAVAEGAVPTGRNDLAPPPGTTPAAPVTTAAPVAPPPPKPAPVVAAPANPAAPPNAPEAAQAPGIAPSGSPPTTPVVPGGPPPSAVPQPRSNTIGPGVRASLEKKPAGDESADKGRRNFLKWSLPVGWVAFSGACASSLVATARFLFPNVLFEPPQSF